jgi:hypothetical protein
MERYRHSETGWVIIISMASACALTALAGLAAPPCGPNTLLFFFAPLFLVVLANFYKLTVVVGDSSVKLAMGAGLIKKELFFSDIASAGMSGSTLIKGWGIRYLGDGWLYNVNSLAAVELKLKNGRRCLIGTDEPAALLAALLSAGIPPAVN